MKVRDLIALLDEMDQDADVYLMLQEGWPFEVSIAGVCERGDFTECEGDEGSGGGAEVFVGNARWSAREARLPAAGVFIVERRPLRYGNKAAWEAARQHGAREERHATATLGADSGER